MSPGFIDVDAAGAKPVENNSMPAHRPATPDIGMPRKLCRMAEGSADILAELKLRPVLVSYRAFDVEVARFNAERRTAKLKTAG